MERTYIECKSGLLNVAAVGQFYFSARVTKNNFCKSDHAEQNRIDFLGIKMRLIHRCPVVLSFSRLVISFIIYKNAATLLVPYFRTKIRRTDRHRIKIAT